MLPQYHHLPALRRICVGGRSRMRLVWSAVVLAVLTAVVFTVMALTHVRARTEDPFKSPELAKLKQTLAGQPKDQELKAKIRSLDLDLRRSYFRRISLNRSGAWLLLGAFSVFVLAARQAVLLRQRPPVPLAKSHQPEPAAGSAVWSRRAVVTAAIAAAVAGSFVVFSDASALPRDSAALDRLLAKAGTARADAPADAATLEEMRRNWPRFRGPSGDGLSFETNAPMTWDRASGAGILWRAGGLPAGFNSPVVWGDRLFLSGGDASKREVVCFSTAAGEVLWRQSVQSGIATPSGAPEIPEQTGYAASTMATDGRRVYAIFANGDLAALSLDGKVLWTKNLGFPKNPHGHASSLATDDGRVIVQWDQGDAEQNLSKLLVFDGASGRVIWQRNRPVSVSWATPLVVTAGRKQVITLAVPWVIAYAAGDGAELWRVEGLNGEVTPSPVLSGGLLLATSPHEKIMAIRPDGQSDVTKTHVVWEAEDNIPDIASPVSNGELVFALTTAGMLTCYDAKDGTKVWEQDLGAESHASPTLVGDRLYVFTTKGVGLVLQANRSYRELARNDLGEKIFASPAFVGGRMYVRGAEHLFCISPQTALARKE